MPSPSAVDVRTPLKQPQHPSYASTSSSKTSVKSSSGSEPHHHPVKKTTTTTTTTTMKVTSTAPPPQSSSSSGSAVRTNPFRYNSPIDAYEKVKIVAMCLLGVPLLRVLLVAVVVLLCALVSNIALLGFQRIDARTGTKRVISAWRQWLASPVPYLVRVGLFVVGYYWIPISTPRGFDRKKGMQRIVVCNHITFVDGLFLLYYLAPSIAMKADVADIPLVGKIVQTTQPILIDRATPEGRKHALREIAEHIAAPEFPPLLIFPEGTTSNQDYLTKFKVGSFTSGTPCQPVVIKYPFRHFDVSWSPGVSGIYLVLRMLCQVYNRLEVQFLPAYFPTQEEVEKPEVYAENVRQVMAQALGVQCTNHAFEDVALLLQVGHYAHEHVVTVTDVGEVMSLTDLRGADIDKLVRYFVKHDLNQDGQISLEEMQQLFPNDDPVLLKRLFALVDANGNGQIDFRELCMGLRALNSHANSADELMKFAFRLYDQDNNGVIDARELESMLRFNQTFYGAEPQGSSVDQVLADMGISATEGGDGQRTITFEVFERLMRSQPDLLGHARSKLEILRGSLRE